MNRKTFHHGIDYNLKISPITMPDALGNGQHTEYSLERVWPRDETGYIQIDSIYIGSQRQARELMSKEIEEGLTVAWGLSAI